jgi:hypothetical protein
MEGMTFYFKNEIITEKEVSDAIKGLKVPDSDKLINDFFLNSPPFLVSIYTKKNTTL